MNQPDIIIVVPLQLSQKWLKEVSTANNCSSKQHLSDKEKKRRKEASTELVLAGFDLLKKYVPGASQLTRPKVLIATANCIAILERRIQRMTENSTVPSPMECTWPFSPVDLTVDSSDSLSPVHEDS
jgi:hypothetical protein